MSESEDARGAQPVASSAEEHGHDEDAVRQQIQPQAQSDQRQDEQRLLSDHIEKLKEEKVVLKTRVTSCRRSVLVSARNGDDYGAELEELEEAIGEVNQLLQSLLECYRNSGDDVKRRKTLEEMEQIEGEFSETMSACVRLQSRQEKTGSSGVRTRSSARNPTWNTEVSEWGASSSSSVGGVNQFLDWSDSGNTEFERWKRIEQDAVREGMHRTFHPLPLVAEHEWEHQSSSGHLHTPADMSQSQPRVSESTCTRTALSSGTSSSGNRPAQQLSLQSVTTAEPASNLRSSSSVFVSAHAQASSANISQARVPQSVVVGSGTNTVAASMSGASVVSPSVSMQSYRVSASHAVNTANTVSASSVLSAPRSVSSSFLNAGQQLPPTSAYGLPSWSTALAAPQSVSQAQMQTSVPFSQQSYYPQAGFGSHYELWKGVKRVEIPVFTGDKTKYPEWKAAFVACVDASPASAEYKFLQLKQFLSGEALKVVSSLTYSAMGYAAAKARLERKYGGKRRQAAVYVEQLEQFPPIRTANSGELERLADLLDVAVINLQDAGNHSELGAGTLYNMLQRKLPESLLAHYHRWIFERGRNESVISLLEWVTQEAEYRALASETKSGLSRQNAPSSSARQDTNPTSARRSGPSYPVNTARTHVSFNSTQGQCLACGQKHAIWTCDVFRQMNGSQRWSVAKREKLCYRCLAAGHRGIDCKRTRTCGVNDCRENHHWLLHKQDSEQGSARQGSEQPIEQSAKKGGGHSQCTKSGGSAADFNGLTVGLPSTDPAREVESTMEGELANTTMTASVDCKNQQIALRTVPVVIRCGKKEIRTNALLDDGSTRSYVNASVAAELGLHGEEVALAVSVLNGGEKSFLSMPVEFTVESLDGTVQHNMTAHTTPARVVGGLNAVNWAQEAKNWRHLEFVNFPEVKDNHVDLLIGVDNVALHVSEAEVKGREGEPVARLTPLGWTCVGCVRPGFPSGSTSDVLFAFHTTGTDQVLDKLVRQFWQIDHEHLSDRPLTTDEQKALNVVTSSLERDGNRYQVSLPWRVKPDELALPDSYSTALRRLQQTEKSLLKNPERAAAYGQVIAKHLENGYVSKVPPDQVPEPGWYLPHFPILRPDKATTKLRIVFDASAKSSGVALNDLLYTGPKLQRNLFDVLVRFRREPVAVVCDIAEMYLQVGIAPRDRPYHRFLWRNLQVDETPTVYQFNRVVFGVNASPFLAQFVSQETARQLKAKYPLAANAVEESTYMDDSMTSASTEDEAKEIVAQLKALWSAAGMHPRKWLSNRPAVLEKVPQEDRVEQLDLTSPELPSIKTAQSTVNRNGIEWSFNPPLAPHFGGAHENLIKSAKRVIHTILQNAEVQDNELQTCFVIAEGLLNSRPLTYQSAHPGDDVPLTPNHFLHGQVGGCFAPEVESGTTLSRRWRFVQSLMERVWHRWMRKWLPRLTPRSKWRQALPDLQVGDVVLVVEADTPRGKWPLARVLDVYPGADNHVRVLQLQQGSRVLRRPITKVCPFICGGKDVA